MSTQNVGIVWAVAALCYITEHNNKVETLAVVHVYTLQSGCHPFSKSILFCAAIYIYIVCYLVINYFFTGVTNCYVYAGFVPILQLVPR